MDPSSSSPEKPDEILLDNFDVDDCRSPYSVATPLSCLEKGLRWLPDVAADYTRTGVDFLAVSLTSAPALDLGLDFD